jgi:dTDP-3-amino-2,3,6-trideoxy-4-keto-D-glucose/dTDP-3-amino-3,4,6-trideoxy-alpha-D-glucose/dTDP-2,6-dideoxy-D-kanosamine transaminase
MTIRVWDYLEEFEEERADLWEGIEKVFRSGRLLFGSSLREFETAFAAYCGVKHGIGVDNATNGLTLALRALGIGNGDEVITVSNTAVPTVSAIVATGATPRFVDIDRSSYLMNVDLVEAAITPATRCILPVHLFGQCADMTRLRDIARRRGLRVVEDCAQSHGAVHNGQKAGSLSDAAVFSFYPTKILGGYGDAGMILTNDEALKIRLTRLRFYGMENTYYAEENGYNSRMDEIHAEILLRKLARLDRYIAARRQIAARYHESLKGTSLILPDTAAGNVHAYYLYVCRHPERDGILAELAQRDIVLNVSYPWPIHIMRGYAFLGYREGCLPETEAAAKEIFSLPMYPSFREDSQNTVCQALKEVLPDAGHPKR